MVFNSGVRCLLRRSDVPGPLSALPLVYCLQRQKDPAKLIAMLFSFIGILFSALPPERGLQFWGSVPSSSQDLADWKLPRHRLENYQHSYSGRPGPHIFATWTRQSHYTTCLLGWPNVTSAAALPTTSWHEVDCSGKHVTSSSGAIAPWATIFGIPGRSHLAMYDPRHCTRLLFNASASLNAKDYMTKRAHLDNLD